MHAFGDDALLFAGTYCALQVVRNAFVVAVTPPGAFHRNFVQILIWSVLSMPLWIGGALVDGGGRWALWLAALAVDLAAPLARYWVPTMGRTPMIEWAIDPGHFAERFQLFVIIVLLHYSTVLSKLADQNTVLAQRLALLEERVVGGAVPAADEPPGEPVDPS